MKRKTRIVPTTFKPICWAIISILMVGLFAQHSIALDNPEPDPYPPEEEPPPYDPCRQKCESGCDSGDDDGNPDCEMPICEEAGSVFFSMGLGRAPLVRKTDSFRNALIAGKSPALPSLAHRSWSFASMNAHYREAPLTAMRQVKMWVAEETISSAIYTTAVLKVDMEAGKELIVDSNGNPRQILTFDRFTDIQPLTDVSSNHWHFGPGIPVPNPQGFVIRTWSAGSQGGMNNGVYALPTTDPLSYTVFMNLDSAPTANRLAITHRYRYNDSGNYKMMSYLHHSTDNAGLNTWVLSKYDGHLSDTQVEKITLEQISRTSDKIFTRVRTVERAALSGIGVYGSLGTVSITLEEFDNIGGNSRLIRKVEAHGTSEERETLYGWYSTSWDQFVHGKLRYIIHPDQSYEHYTYSFNVFSRVGTITRRTPWKDYTWTPSTSLPSNNECIREIYTIYENSLSMQRYVGSTIVASTTESWSTSGGFRIFTQSERYDSTQSLTTVTGYHPATADPHLANRIAWREFADGTAETYAYTALSSGTYTQTVERGAGNRHGITAGTRTITTRNSHGASIAEETLFFEGSNSIQLEYWVATGIESTFGRVTRREWNGNFHDYETTEYGCCGIAERRDRRGVVTTYSRDALKRTYRVTRTTGSIVQATIISHTYGANSIITQTQVSYDNEYLLSSKNTRHINGETLEVQGADQTGNEDTGPTMYLTEYPSAGGRQVTITRPDGSTVVTLYFVDGNLKSRTGTGVNNTAYDHGAHTLMGNGMWKRTTALDASGNATSEFTTHYHDRAGRVFRTEFNSQIASSGTQDAITHQYHSHTAAAGSRGKRSSTTDADGVITSFTYDSQGRQNTTTEFMPVSAGTTRVTATEHSAQATSDIGPSWLTITRVNNVEVSRTLRAGNGYATQTRTSQTRTTTGVRSAPSSAAAHTWHETTTQPDGTRTRNYYVDGRLVATTRWQNNVTLANIPTTAPANITNVTSAGFIEGQSFTYDGFDRLMTSTDSRTGTTEFDSYTESGNLLSVTDPGSRTTTFEYDLMGRRIKSDAPDTTIVGGTSHNITHTS